jgi:hypothetical protein
MTVRPETGKCSAKTISCLHKSLNISGAAFETVEDGSEGPVEARIPPHSEKLMQSQVAEGKAHQIINEWLPVCRNLS